MESLGAPVAYLVLRDGVPVYDRDRAEIGTVAHVLADEGPDIFHGLLVRLAGSPQRYLFAGRDQIDGLYQHGVTLTVTRAGLHEPAEDSVAADAVGGERVREGLRRAWDWMSRPR